MSSRFSNPETALALGDTSDPTRHNTVESDQYADLNLLDDDRIRLEDIIGVDEFDLLADVNYSSNRMVTDATSLIAAISALDGAAAKDSEVLKTTSAALSGTVSVVNGSLTFTVDTGTDVITTSASHGMSNGQAVRLETSGALPGGLTAGTTYYIGATTSTTGKLYATSAAAVLGGSDQVNITTSGSGTHGLNGLFVHGSGTSFTSQVTAGDYIYIDDLTSKVYQVATVESDTVLVLYSETAQADASSVARKLVSFTYPAIFATLPELQADPTTSNQATRKSYVDNLSSSYRCPKGYINGKFPQWASASQITFKSGLKARNSIDTGDIELAGDVTVSLASSGAAGLDTGSEASNTWYYFYLIKKSSDGTTSVVASTVNESVSGSITYPSGYDLKRQLPYAVRNDNSSNILDHTVVGSWDCPLILYNTEQPESRTSTTKSTEVLDQGTATSFTGVSCTSFIPPCSQMGYFYIMKATSGALGYIRPTGSGFTNGNPFQGYDEGDHFIFCKTNSSQSIDYKVSSSALDIHVRGFFITEIA